MPETDDPQNQLPIEEPEMPSIIGALAGSVEWYGDLISPIAEIWEADE
jgi:hypothetical protein